MTIPSINLVRSPNDSIRPAYLPIIRIIIYFLGEFRSKRKTFFDRSNLKLQTEFSDFKKARTKTWHELWSICSV